VRPGGTSSGYEGLRLHLERPLQTGRPGAQTVLDLLAPGSIDETLRLLEHRLRLEVAIGVDLACGDGRQRAVNGFAFKVWTWAQISTVAMTSNPLAARRKAAS
jgi:hypothetical protein